jgi:hypothetical protein
MLIRAGCDSEPDLLTEHEYRAHPLSGSAPRADGSWHQVMSFTSPHYGIEQETEAQRLELVAQDPQLPTEAEFSCSLAPPFQVVSQTTPTLLCSGSVHFSSASLPQAWEPSCPTLASDASKHVSLSDRSGPRASLLCLLSLQDPSSPSQHYAKFGRHRPLFLSSLWAVG